MAKPHRPVKKANHGKSPCQRQGPQDQATPRSHVIPGRKGDSPHLCEAPFGPFRQMGTVPFFLDLSWRSPVVGKRELILDFGEYDVNHLVADAEEIRRYNPQRHEMEQLTAICYEDPARHICVGYKDLGRASSGCGATCRECR